MGLFINHHKHPEVYKNHEQVNPTNQDVFQQDRVAEAIEEQQKECEALQANLSALEEAYEKQVQMESTKIAEITNHIHQENHQYFEQQTLKNEELSSGIAKQFLKQEDFEQHVGHRLDKQDALIDKMMRKVEYLRMFLSERTHLLSGKIERGYQSTSNHLHKMMTVRKELKKPSEKERHID